MTEIEAKKILRASLECEEKESAVAFDYQCDKDCFSCELNYAQGTVGEHKEAIEMAIKALEKQIPKKPNKCFDFSSSLFVCPTCYKKQRIIYEQYYCKECGQKLDWSDEE